MFELRNKTILVISPQSWGTMYVSKHHYALELAKRGNTVYFLNPPEQNSKGKRFIKINVSGVHANLLLITHRLFFPFDLKFHALPVFQWLMGFHLRGLVKKLGRSIDIIWSFELGNLYPFHLFDKGALKIFHPVDEPLSRPAIDAAKGADIIFSVTNEILEKYKAFKIPSYFVNHGVTETFLRVPKKEYEVCFPVRAGLSGNLLRGDLDRETLLQIIQSNPAVQFDCWGSFLLSQANIGGANDKAANEFIGRLQQLENVKLHGAITSDKLADEIQQADAFLICYDIIKDQSRGTNYHKIMEYLATGKVIVSNNVTTYKDMPHLVQMTTERDNNKALPALFSKVIHDLTFHNSRSLRDGRYEFANSNTYKKQVERIEDLLSKLRKA